MNTENKRLVIFLSIATAILLLPLIAMQFTAEVNWTLFDFIVAGVLLYGTAFLLDFVIKKFSDPRSRRIAVTTVVLGLLLLWAELAVGIFGSPIAGS